MKYRNLAEALEAVDKADEDYLALEGPTEYFKGPHKDASMEAVKKWIDTLEDFNSIYVNENGYWEANCENWAIWEMKDATKVITAPNLDLKTVEAPTVGELAKLKKDHKALVRRVEDLELVLNHALTTPTPEKLKQIVNNSSVKEVAEWIRKLT